MQAAKKYEDGPSQSSVYHFPLVPSLPPNPAITPSSGWWHAHLSSAAVHKITHFKYWSDLNKPPYISLSPSHTQSRLLPEVRGWSPGLGGGKEERQMKGDREGAWARVYPVEVNTDGSGCSLGEGMTLVQLSDFRETLPPSVSVHLFVYSCLLHFSTSYLVSHCLEQKINKYMPTK